MIYEGTITYLSAQENGLMKKKKEQYIIDNKVAFSDAETLLYEQFNGLEALEVVALKRSNIREIANSRTSEDEVIFVATVVDVFLCDDGSEKEIKYKIAFYSKDMNAAHAYINGYIRQGYNMGIMQIKATKFLEAIE